MSEPTAVQQALTDAAAAANAELDRLYQQVYVLTNELGLAQVERDAALKQLADALSEIKALVAKLEGAA